MAFSREVRHRDSRRARIIRGPDPHSVHFEARAQLEAWELQWASRNEEDILHGPVLPETYSKGEEISKEEGHRIAQAQTGKAQEELNQLGAIFPGEAPADPPVPVQAQSFSEPRPEEPDLPDPEPKPIRSDPRFRPELTVLDRLVPARRKEREREAEVRFKAAWTAWYEREQVVEDALARYQREFEAWNARRIRYESRQRKNWRNTDGESAVPDPADRESTIEYFSRVLSRVPLPSFFPQDVEITYEPSARLLTVEFRLPAMEDIPSLEKITFREAQGDFLEEHLPRHEHQRAYDSVVFQTVLRTVKEIFESEGGREVSTVSFSGWARVLDRATGRKRRLHLARLDADRERYAEIVPERVSPEVCFRAMGGEFYGIPHLAPSMGSPSARTQPEDSVDAGPRARAKGDGSTDGVEDRIDVEGDKEGGSPMKSGPGASERIPTSVRDFHRLILRTLEEKLLPEGAELQVTVARQDGGLEVIGRSRGSPERGGVLFHVERVTAPVPQGSMQNLLDRMRVEEAAHGVFLTVGTFSPEAAALAEGEPVSLFDGSSLAEILGSGPIAGTRPQDDSMGDLGLADLRPQ